MIDADVDIQTICEIVPRYCSNSKCSKTPKHDFCNSPCSMKTLKERLKKNNEPYVDHQDEDRHYNYNEYFAMKHSLTSDLTNLIKDNPLAFTGHLTKKNGSNLSFTAITKKGS